MRTPLKNKSMNFENISQVNTDRTLSRNFEAIMKRCEEIEATLPAKREKLLADKAAAAENKALAQNIVDNTTNEKDYIKALMEARKAREAEQLADREIQRLNEDRRMDEVEYYKDVENIVGVQSKALDEYRRIAEKAVNELLEAKQKYLAVMTDANNTLIKLDSTSNVLQTKYKYVETKFVNQPSIFTESVTEWMDHTVRFNGSELYIDQEGTVDRKLKAAWDIDERMYL